VSDCVFCKLINRELPTTFIYEDEHVVSFSDISPQAPVHVLIVPKLHIMASVEEIHTENSAVVQKVFEAIPLIAKELGVSGNYRVISNCGEGAGQSVQHLHFHMLSGATTMRTRLL